MVVGTDAPRLPPKACRLQNRELFISAVRGLTHNVEVFLARGADPDLRVMFDNPLIALCASLGRNQAVRLLLGAGANVNAAAPIDGCHRTAQCGQDGERGLGQAAHRARSRSGSENEEQSDPTDACCQERKYREPSQFFSRVEQELDATDRTDRTALDYARRKNHPEVVEMLVEARSHKVSSEL